MSNESNYLSRLRCLGKLSRRDFLGRAAALGVTATFATPCCPAPRAPRGPVKGGSSRPAWSGGASTNSLDPALLMTPGAVFFGKPMGRKIVELSPDGAARSRRSPRRWGASDDAKVWTLKIRDGVEFHNGKR